MSKTNNIGKSKHVWIPSGEKYKSHCNLCGLDRIRGNIYNSITGKWNFECHYFKFGIEVANKGCVVKS